MEDSKEVVNSQLRLSEIALEDNSRNSSVIFVTMRNESRKLPCEVLNISSGLIARQDVGNKVQNLLADLSRALWI